MCSQSDLVETDEQLKLLWWKVSFLGHFGGFVISGLFTVSSLLIIKMANIEDFAGLVEARLLASFHLVTNKAKHVKSQQNRHKQWSPLCHDHTPGDRKGPFISLCPCSFFPLSHISLLSFVLDWVVCIDSRRFFLVIISTFSHSCFHSSFSKTPPSSSPPLTL